MGYSRFRAITNNPVMNILIHVFWCVYMVYIFRSRIARSYSIFIFNFNRSYQSFPMWLYNLSSFQWCMSATLHSHQHMLLSIFYFSCSGRSVVVSHVRVNFIFLWYLIKLGIFSYVYGCLFSEESVQIPIFLFTYGFTEA